MAGQIKKITVGGETYEIGGGISAPISTTYSELKSLKESSQLVIGQKYRITDFVSVFDETGITSANHPFDLIIEANANNGFSETAIAILHEGDDYFANQNLGAWQVSYCFDNDTKRFSQASSSGKGFISYLKDEYGNEACYDFKNALFQLSSTDYDFVPGTINAYTFSTYITDMSDSIDASLNANSVVVKNCSVKSFNRTVLMVKKPSLLSQNLSENVLYSDGDGIVMNTSMAVGALMNKNNIKGSLYLNTSSGFKSNTVESGSRSFKLKLSGSNSDNNKFIYYAAAKPGSFTSNKGISKCTIKIDSDPKLTLNSCTLELTDAIILESESEHTISSQDFKMKNVKVNSDGTYKAIDPFA